jgi:DNA-binding MarR family transcriptional regulator
LVDGTQLEILRQSSTTREELGLLAVMDALEQRDRITQRELARVTGLTLKKVNYSLRKLLEKGHVKFQRARSNPDRRAYLYILTPSGLKAKSWLTYRFVKFTLEFYNRMEEKLSNCLQAMDRASVERIVLFGATDIARILLDLAQRNGVDVVGVIDASLDISEFHGVLVIDADRLKDHDWDVILITNLDDPEGAAAQLMEHGLTRDVIWQLS